MRGTLADTPALRERAQALTELISAALPREARHILGESEDARMAILERLAAEGTETVLAHLGTAPADPEGGQ